MKYILLAFIIIGIKVDAQENNEKICIRAIVGGNTKGYNKIYCYGDGIPDNLSQELKNDTVEFRLPFYKPVFVLFYSEFDVKVKRGYQPFGVLIDRPGLVTITLEDIESGFNNSKIEGLQSALLFHSFNLEKKKIYKEIFELVRKNLGKGWVPNDDPDFEKINKSRDSLINIIFYPYVIKFINQNKDSYASVFILNEYKGNLDFIKTIENYMAFENELKYSTPGQQISDYIVGIKNSQDGTLVKDFSLITNEDKPFEFAQLRGKYVLLDFWASWCGPCRESFPHMRDLYNKYKRNNIEFVNISIDKNKDAWLQAVAKEGNPWPQLLDNKNVSLQFFGVSSVPTTFLIDINGKILMKEIGLNSNGSGAIENKIKLLFDH